MSRVGKHPVAIPQGVEVAIAGQQLTAKGKLGQLSLALPEEVEVSKENGTVVVKPLGESTQARALWGTTRANINNVLAGVSKGFVRNLEISGVGYRAAVSGKKLTLQLGYSHDVVFDIPAGINIKCEKPTSIEISGADKQQVGQVAAKIRGFRPPEPYKGKGIKYSDETIRRKEGKKK
ncbi:MAG TPA: 50S ribosomal protein L6 [Kiloniellales bacterium]|nr:50S ribosomal protein L6 [Kiloniellales bacterium]